MTRYFIHFFIIFLLVAAATMDGASETRLKTAGDISSAPAQKTEDRNNFYCLGRGVTNVGTCYLEIFRCMIYDNAEVPFWGFIQGACEGSALTVWRAFGGVVDIMFLGFAPGSIYTKSFPDFIWQAHWLPPKEQLNGRP